MNLTANPHVATREVDVTPYASALVEGHRDFGYSLETALADIVDNAITAGARRVEVTAVADGEEPWIAIADDGCGMAEAELIEAMRLGSKNPTDPRAPEDLGRFGLGLKSASFSQCRRLTVLTRHDGVSARAGTSIGLRNGTTGSLNSSAMWKMARVVTCCTTRERS